MLIELVVEELGVIERAELSFEAGSAALTGETGAGKTLLVSALGLLMGGRADKDLVRQGASRSRVEGRFLVRPDHPCALQGEELDLCERPSDPEQPVELVLSRVVSSDGRSSKARVNGHIVTLATLEGFGTRLLGIAGQNEHQRLADPHFQRALLDAAAEAGTLELSAELAREVRSAAAARSGAEELRVGERARSRELDVLRYEIAEIEAAGIQPGEGDRLLDQAEALEDAAAVSAAFADVADHISGDGGALERLADAIVAARGAERSDAAASVLSRLTSIEIELTDISAEIARAASAAPDPVSLEDIRDRIGELQKLRRKYGADDAEVLAYLEDAHRRADELASATSRADQLDDEAEAHQAEALRLAQELTRRRQAAAGLLKDAVEARLADLSLAGARFEVRLEQRHLYEGGAESVTFMFGADEQTLRPLAKAASGGELSRVALALYLVTAAGDVETVLFDEVDAGVGGETARSVGRSLAELARTAGIQTLVVTHLPQVAAYSDVHFKVLKTAAEDGSGSVSSIKALSTDERVDELSRMLAGLPDSQLAQEHARELLEVARAAASAA